MAVLLCFMMYACADKEYEVPKDEIVGVETRSTSLCDFEFCSNVQWQPKSLTVSYLGCPFMVTFEWRKCNQAVEVQNFNFNFDNSNARCNTVRDSIGQFWLNGQSLQANTAYNALHSQLTLDVQEWVLDQLIPSDFSILTPISFQFIETDCHTLCVVMEVDFEQNVTFEIGHVKCGESCCVRSGGIRFDENDDAFIFDQQLNSGDPCEATIVNCTGSYNPEICTPACDRL